MASTVVNNSNRTVTVTVEDLSYTVSIQAIDVNEEDVLDDKGDFQGTLPPGHLIVGTIVHDGIEYSATTRLPFTVPKEALETAKQYVSTRCVERVLIATEGKMS